MTTSQHFRAFERRSAGVRATLSTADGRWTRNVHVVNLSLGGACVEVAGDVPASPLTLRLVAPHLWDPLALDAHTAWSRAAPDGKTTALGLRFAPSSGAAVRALHELLFADRYE